MTSQQENGHPNTKIYYPVTWKKRVGALIATPETVAFYNDENNGEKAIELDWQQITKITANKATGPVSLLRLTQINGQHTTFRLDSRDDLVLAKKEMKTYWKAAHEVSMRNYDDEDFSESKRDDDDFLVRRASNKPQSRIDSGIEAKTLTPTESISSPKSLQVEKDPFLLPRKANPAQFFRLDVSNFIQTQAIQVGIVNADGIVEETPRTIELEGLWKDSNNDDHDTNNNDDYHISKGIFRVASVAIICGFFVMLCMAAALVVLSVLLWEEKSGQSQTQVTYEDDFYAGYYSNNPP